MYEISVYSKEDKMTVRQVRISDNVTLGGGQPLALIAGPCVIESESHALRMAESLRVIADKLGMPFIFKASFDKANRSSLSGHRGPGLEEGLSVLRRIKLETGLPVISDIHGIEQVAPAAEVLDVIQIPAFLCRQTDLLLAAGRSGVPVNVKKGQFLAPWDMENVVAKIESTGNTNVTLTERGNTFGYNNLVSDMRALPIMRGFGVPVIFDATHSVQLPGGQGSCSGGDREMAHVLARAAVAAGVDGIFLEVHDDPDRALCDGPNMIALHTLESLLSLLLKIDAAVRPLLQD
jgi:2-dehydro-3-deoxyphosphooctonate aldolase (KDO 8-P synthase)